MGLLLVAKTKVAMDKLKEQFWNRNIQKMYTAIVNGSVMREQLEYQQQQLKQNGDKKGHQHPNGGHSNDHEEACNWNLIDYPLGGKHALTSWRILERARSLNARDGVLTKVEVKLHKGRYRQIRRHFAWWCRRPLVGDHLYAGMLQAHHFRKKGLFLTSSGISFPHPVVLLEKSGGGGEESQIAKPRRIEVTIDAPKRFGKLMKAEESWANNNLQKEKDNYRQQYH